MFCLAVCPFTGFSQIWQPLANGIETTPQAMTAEGGAMAVAYTLGYEKNRQVHEVAIWNGIYWSKLPKIYTDSNSRINSLLFKDSGLYIGGHFDEFNNVKWPHNLVKWNGREYHGLPELTSGTTFNHEEVLHLGHLGDILVVGGSFKNEVMNGGNNLAFFNDGKWISGSVPQATNINGPVHASVVAGGRFYIGGRFTKIGTSETSYFASFNGVQAFKHAKNEFVPQKMVSLDTSMVFYGKHATDKARMPEFFLSNTDTFYALNNGIDVISEIYDIVSDGKRIYAVGVFTLDGIGVKQKFIKFEDGKWQKMVGGEFDGLQHVALLRDHVIVGGAFKSYRNIKLTFVARYVTGMGVATGKIYFDKNEDCKFNSRDESLNDRIINIEPGGFYIRPETEGNFLVYLKPGSYTFTVLPRKYWHASPCNNLKKNVVIKEGEVMDTLNFALVQDTSIRDLSVNLLAQTGGLATRKNVQMYYLNYENLGSNEVNDGILTLHFDPKLVNLKASPQPIISGDSAIWKNLNIRPGVPNVIKCAFEISSDAEEKLNLDASIRQNAPTEDIDQGNNQSSLTQNIQEQDIEISKQVNPGKVSGDTAYIDPGTESVDYQISFSNFSSDTVTTVYVVDTIQINHSLKEIRETGASHPYTYQIIPGKPGENVATIIWTFVNINLAPNPSRNGEIVTDDGFIGFRIGLKPNLSEGVMLYNRANVAFDFSEDKSTNMVYAMVTETTGTGFFPVNKAIKLYPNPVTTTLHLRNWEAEGLEYGIFDLKGMEVKSGSTGLDQSIPVEELADGVYVLKLNNNGAVHSGRFVKIH